MWLDIFIGGGYPALRKREYGWDEPYNTVLVDQRDMNALVYWMNNAVGFDAICIDMEHEPSGFSKIMGYIRSLPESKDKPIWWSEFYASQNTTMAEVAMDIASAMQNGDRALWWTGDGGREMDFSPL